MDRQTVGQSQMKKDDREEGFQGGKKVRNPDGRQYWIEVSIPVTCATAYGIKNILATRHEL